VTPSRLGKYELLTRLASGGMAEIYVARDTTAAGAIVIIKRMLPQFVDNPAFVEMFLDEGRTVSLLHHANLIEMHDFGFEHDTPYLAMEYLHGVDVRTMTRVAKSRARQVPLQVSLTIVAEVCAGLHHAHEARTLDGYPLELVHRDVSPQNAFLTFAGAIKVIDFGIAKVRGRVHETAAGALKGKVPYMAPEQIRGKDVDRRTDIYAAGVLLYELTLGRLPYLSEPGEDPRGEFNLMMAIVNHRVARPTAVRPNLPLAIERILTTALAAHPADRYPTAAAMRDAIDVAAKDHWVPIDPTVVTGFLRELFGDHEQRWRGAHTQGDAELVTQIDELAQARTRAGALDDPTKIDARELAEPAAAEPAPAPPPRSLDEVSVISLPPRIDEHFAGAARAQAMAGSVVLDLGRVERISSFGVREWFELHRALAARTDQVAVYLARCSEAIVAQLSVIRTFGASGHVVSFLAPYLCAGCGHAFAHAFDCERDAAVLAQPAHR
jgi:eukaryotic-like serine/threonine-protein kinase